MESENTRSQALKKAFHYLQICKNPQGRGELLNARKNVQKSITYCPEWLNGGSNYDSLDEVVDEEPTFVTPNVIRKPDLIAKQDDRAIVIDAQIVNESIDLTVAHKNNVEYYQCLKEATKQWYHVDQVHFTSTTLSYRGVWSLSSVNDLVDMAIIKKELKIVSARVLED